MENIKFKPPIKKDRIFEYIKKYKARFILTAIFGIFCNTAIVLGPIFQGKLLDSAIEGNTIKDILIAGAMFILVTLFFQIGRYFKRYFVRDTANRISGDMRIGLIESILNTDISNIEKNRTGDMMTTVIGDVDIIKESIRKTNTEIWDTGVQMLAYFITLFLYDWKLTLTSVVPLPFVIILTILMKEKVHNQSVKSRKTVSKSTTQIRKIVSEVNMLRLYGREENEVERLNENLKTQTKEKAKLQILQNGMAPIYSSLATLGIVLVIYMGGNNVINGMWTIGTLTAYITMFLALTKRVTTVVKVINLNQGSKASWERIKNLLNQQKTAMTGKKSETLNNISVENMSFKYETSVRNVIKNISFDIPKGSVIGITGPIGSGKTTLGLTLTGLYKYNGKFLINETNVKDINYKDRISKISYMGHDAFLFSDTLKNNITWEDNNDEKLQKVIDIVNLNKDIEGFSDDVNTQVGEKGALLSGGQRQRIALARALYKDSEIIILDEPLSAVDVKTEKKIINELQKNIKDKVVFIISHRLSIFQYVDKILVLNNGEIAQVGNHNELIKEDGIYRQIVISQTFMKGV